MLHDPDWLKAELRPERKDRGKAVLLWEHWAIVLVVVAAFASAAYALFNR